MVTKAILKELKKEGFVKYKKLKHKAKDAEYFLQKDTHQLVTIKKNFVGLSHGKIDSKMYALFSDYSKSLELKARYSR
jgi:hypothetical protein